MKGGYFPVFLPIFHHNTILRLPRSVKGLGQGSRPLKTNSWGLSRVRERRRAWAASERVPPTGAVPCG